MENKMRVGQPQHPYVIDVNDQGDTIVFDLADTAIGVRLLDMIQRIERIDTKYQRKAAAMALIPERAVPGTPFTEKQATAIRLVNDFYTDARKAVDIFLGEGACQKIFGTANYPGMFSDLLAQLAPHFEKMGLAVDHIKAMIAARYLPGKEAVLR